MTSKHKRKIRRLNPVNVLAFFFREERRSSGFLLAAAAVGILLANSPLSDKYFSLLSHPLPLAGLHFDARHWINEGLMAIFFLVVGLEVRREFVDGELNTWRRAAFPIYAAVGGMLAPAAIFSALNPGAPQNNGWAIAMATDVALAVGVLGLLGRHVPKSLRIFLLSLAIVDDVGSILVISLFYVHPANMLLVVCAVLLSLSLFILRKQLLWPLSFLVVGCLIWYCLVSAGLSGTIAGVIVAFAMPLTKRRKNVKRLLPSEVIEDALVPVVSFVVVPLFALANIGVRLRDVSFATHESITVFAGVFLGLAIGKPLGVTVAAWLSHVLRLAHKPVGLRWPLLWGVGFIAGTGFTISLLITNLAYEAMPELQNAATVGIMCATALSALLGLLITRKAIRTH